MHYAMFALGVTVGAALPFAVRKAPPGFGARIIASGHHAFARGIRVRIIRRSTPGIETLSLSRFQFKMQDPPLAQHAPVPSPVLAENLPGPDAKFEEFLAAVPQSMPVIATDEIEAESGSTLQDR